MSILAECPFCHKKQATKNKRCTCGADLDQLKGSKKVKYWISYRLPNGKQKRESVNAFKDLHGYSIEDARTALSKRKVQKAERRLLDIKPEFKTTFNELAEWYLNLERVKSLASYKTIKGKMVKFNKEFGNTIVGNIKLSDLENLQEKRKREGLKPKTIDDDINYVKSMVISAFNNDLVGGDVLKAFQRVRALLKKNSNARDRILTMGEYEGLLSHSPKHLRDILVMGYWTGMRKSEILNLKWSRVDLKSRMICLEVEDTKERKSKNIPIGKKVYKVLSKIPRSIHGGHVFLYWGRPIGHFTTALKTACEEVRITYGREVKDGFTFHDMRHSFVTDMRKAGVSKSVRMSITGHSPKDMDDRYNRIDDQDKLEGIKRLEAYRFLNGDQSVDQKAF